MLGTKAATKTKSRTANADPFARPGSAGTTAQGGGHRERGHHPEADRVGQGRKGKGKGKGGGKQTKQASQWWAQAVEVPRAETPDYTRIQKRSRRLRIYTSAAAFLFPVSCLGWFVSMNHGGSTATTAAASDVYSRYAATRSLAIDAVNRWLAADPAPLPDGHLLSWDGATQRHTAATRTAAGYTVQVHHLTVADDDGDIYQTSVTITVPDKQTTTASGGTSGGGVPYVSSAPTLIPTAPSSPTGDGSSTQASLWPGDLPAYTASPAVVTAIKTWAAGMSSGDPQQLATAIGDGSHPQYLPLVGATLGDPSVVDAASLQPTLPEGATPTKIIVEATFPITWKGHPVADQAQIPTVTYDLRLDFDSKGSPTVDAWGGAGTGPTLKPYDNAVKDGVTFTAETLQDDSGAAQAANDPAGVDQPSGKASSK